MNSSSQLKSALLFIKEDKFESASDLATKALLEEPNNGHFLMIQLYCFIRLEEYNKANTLKKKILMYSDGFHPILEEFRSDSTDQMDDLRIKLEKHINELIGFQLSLSTLGDEEEFSKLLDYIINKSKTK